MPLLRAPDGSIVNLPDEQVSQAQAGGYEPVSVNEAGKVTGEAAPEDTGALGGVNAFTGGALSGLTLGGSDYLLKGLLNRGEFEHIRAQREQHPIAAGAGQVVGAIAPSLVAPESLLANAPSGILSRGTASLAEGGAARALVASGVEGAVQNAGAYLSDTALGDRDLSAEGLRAALGAGFEFGAGGGVAALGIEKGTIAARRMFSRLADGSERAATEAEQAWLAQYQATLEANDAAADVARAKLAEAQLARQQAQLAQQRAAAGLADARAGAGVPVGETPPGAGAVPGSGEAAAGAPGLQGGAQAVASQTPDAEIAGLLHDRAMASARPDLLAAWDAQHGAQLEAALKARGPRTFTSGPATDVAGVPPELAAIAAAPPESAAARAAALSESAEAELAAALREHDAARADLDGLLQRLEVPEVGQQPAVPIGEFGAPGARGIKSPEEIARAAAGERSEPRFAGGTPQGAQPVTRQLRGMGGSPIEAEAPGAAPGIPDHAVIKAHEIKADAPLEATVPARTIAERGYYELPGAGEDAVRVARARQAIAEGQREPIDLTVSPSGKIFANDGRHRLAAAIEADAPIKVKWSTGSEPAEGDVLRAGADRMAITRESEAAIATEPKLADAVEEFGPIARKKNLSSRECADGACDMIEPDFRMAHPELKLSRHRFDLVSDEGAAEVQRLYKMTDAELAEMKAENARRMKDLAVPAKDMFHQVSITPNGTVIDWTANQFHDLPVPYVFQLRPAAREAGGDLEALLRGTGERINAGEDLVAMGAPARAEYLAAKQVKTAAASEHFRAQAIARNYAGSAMAAEERAAQPMADIDKFFADLRRPKTRDAYVAQNIGRAMREEGSHAAALAKVEQEWRALQGGGSAEAAAAKPATWREFQASKMAEYMRSEGGHAGAMKRLGKEWRALRDGEVRRLEVAHDAATERAATAADPAERAAATQEAQALERQLTAVGTHPGAAEDVAAAAPVVTRYEHASARLAEALGDAAPPAAKESAQAFRAAQDAADRKTMDRATRAIDEHVSGSRANGPVATSAADYNEQRVKQGLGDALAKPPRGAPNPRTAAAKADKLRADAGLAHARAAETEARIGASTARRTADEYRAAVEAARGVSPAPAAPSRLGSVVTAVAAAGELGIPGVPHPKDIPVIGPLLSLWAKYRIAKAMMGRFAGRVAATGDVRAAALAARTKDKVAVAVDRTLGLAAEVAPKARQTVVATATVLGHRLIDDGEPDAPRGANAQELAAVRIREISAANARPDLVTALVRKQLGPVADPDLIAAAEQVLQQQFQYLAGVMPKLPPANPYARTKFVPSPGAAADLADRIAVMHAPEAAFQAPTPAKADALASFYPKLFAFAQQRLAERAAELEEPMSHRDQLVASLIFRVPITTSMHPGSMVILQSAHAAAAAAMQPAPAAQPIPSIAGPTNLNQLYQPAGDRRAAR